MYTTEFAEEESIPPPYLFKHYALVQPSQSAGKKIAQKKLINTINHIHFTEGRVWVHLRDPHYEEDLFVRAHPEPCTGKTITCRWPANNTANFECHSLLNLIIDDGMLAILVPIKLSEVDENYFTIDVPNTSYLLEKRTARRFPCHGVTAELNQSGFMASGRLLDFSPLAFRIKVTPSFGGSFHWLNPDETLVVSLYHDQQIVFSGSCRFINQTGNMSVKEIVVTPLVDQFKRFRGRKIRSPRTRLTPSSSISFDHPFFGEMVQRDLYDISVTGFSVHERDGECVLVPGMIVHKLNINYSGTMTIPCTAQVIYRQKEKNGVFRCGLVILDMDIVNYGKLSNILGNVVDSHVHVSDEINMDALWKFFFETGFIYPKKYNLIYPYKDNLKETYRKLYQGNTEVAAHMTYQRNGQIYGHVSMVKAYERSWMVHHLAAMPVSGTRKHTGVPLLKQIIHYFEGFYRLPAFQMDYWICYYRPSTRFMDLFFGDFVRHLKNPQACSLDIFAYKDHPTTPPRENLPDEWLLREYSDTDAPELEQFYRNHSGGLLLNVLCPEYQNDETLEETYKRHGLVRKTKIYSLLHMQKLKAVLVVNQSDLGLNLSELLNGIKIIITDPVSMPWNVLSSAVSGLTDIYDINKIPLLIYPHSYLKDKDISYEKEYIMFTMDMQHGKEFLDYLKGKLKTKIRFYIKYLIKRFLAK